MMEFRTTYVVLPLVLLLFTVVALLLQGCFGVPVGTFLGPSSSIYQNERYGFTFVYPKSWRIEQQEVRNGPLFFIVSFIKPEQQVGIMPALEVYEKPQSVENWIKDREGELLTAPITTTHKRGTTIYSYHAYTEPSAGGPIGNAVISCIDNPYVFLLSGEHPDALSQEEFNLLVSEFQCQGRLLKEGGSE